MPSQRSRIKPFGVDDIHPGLAFILVSPYSQGSTRKLPRDDGKEFQGRTETSPNLVKVLDFQDTTRSPIKLQHLGTRLEDLGSGNPDFLPNQSGQVGDVVSAVRIVIGGSRLSRSLRSRDESTVSERGGLEERIPRLEGEQEREVL